MTGPAGRQSEGHEGDGVGDRKHHGGADKAVCAYSVDHTPCWEELLALTLPPAALSDSWRESFQKLKHKCP